MSILPWLNVDLSRPDCRAADVRAAGARGIRFPLWGGLDPALCAPFIDLARWGVAVPQSADWSDPHAAASALAEKWAHALTHLQVWNEPDGQGLASATLDAATLGVRAAALASAFRARNPSITIVAPGIIGRPEYLNDLDLGLYDALDAHIYGRAEDVPYYLPRFPTSLPILIGETWADPALLHLLATQPRVIGLAPWLHSPPDVPNLGIQLDPDRLAAFRALANDWTRIVLIQGGSMATLDDAQRAAYRLADSTIPYNPDAAIPKKWLQMKLDGQFVGAPIGPEMHLGDVDGQPRAAQAFTSGCLLVWWGGDVVKVA